MAADTGAKLDAVPPSAFLLTQIYLAVLLGSQAVGSYWTKIKLSKEFGPQMSVFSGHSSCLPHTDCQPPGAFSRQLFVVPVPLHEGVMKLAMGTITKQTG